MQDYYEVLQVHPKADQETIRAAYERLRERYAPSALEGATNDTIQEVRAKRAALEHAYAVLGNEQSRAAYDAQMQAQAAAQTSSLSTSAQEEEEVFIDYRPLPPALGRERPHDFDTQPYLTMQQVLRLEQEQNKGRAVNRMPYWAVPMSVTALLTFLTVFITVLIAGVGAPRIDPSTIARNPMRDIPGMETMPPEMQMVHQYSEQIQAAKQVTQQAPDNPQAWIKLGHILFDSVQIVRERIPKSETYRALIGRWLEASDAYRKALELDPTNASVRSDLAVCLCNYGQDTNQPSYVEQGLAEARRAAQEGPEEGRVLLNLGTCLVRTQPPQVQEALTHWQKILHLPNVPQNITISAQRLIAQYSQSSNRREIQ